ADDQKLLARYVAAQEVPPERLRDLARRRAEAARTALASQGADAGRLLLVAEPAPDGDPAVVVALAAAPAPEAAPRRPGDARAARGPARRSGTSRSATASGSVCARVTSGGPGQKGSANSSPA